MKHCRVFRLIKFSILRYKRRFVKEDGQTLIEFLLLFFVMISLSFILMQQSNSFVADRWQAFITVIAKPSTSNIQIP